MARTKGFSLLYLMSSCHIYLPYYGTVDAAGWIETSTSARFRFGSCVSLKHGVIYCIKAGMPLSLSPPCKNKQ